MRLLLCAALFALQIAPPPTGRGAPPQAGPPRPTAPGAISGRITDASGNPVAGVEVRTMRRFTVNAVPQLMSSSEVGTTDVDGRYRLPNRGPGKYYVVALPHVMERTPPLAGATVRKAPPAQPGPDGRPLGYVTTFFPGASAERDATPVTVATDELRDVDFVLARRPVFSVTGQVPGVGRPPSTVILVPARVEDQMGGINVKRVATGSDGRFEFPEVPDGDYFVTYRGFGNWAEGSLTVAGAPPASLTLTLRPDRIVTGRVEFVGRTPAPAIEPARMGMPPFAIELRPAALTIGTSYSVAPLQPDGTFSARGSGPGPLLLRARAPQPWVQVSGMIDGVDTLDLPYAGMSGATDAVIVLADRSSSLLVSVRNEIDRPATDATVILFSEDARYWTALSRRLRLSVLTPGGTVTLNDVPPGKYFLLAGRDFGPGRAISPAFIESIKARALPIEIAAGASRTANIRVN